MVGVEITFGGKQRPGDFYFSSSTWLHKPPDISLSLSFFIEVDIAFIIFTLLIILN